MLVSWQGQKNLEWSAESIGISEQLKYSEVSTGDPHIWHNPSLKFNDIKPNEKKNQTLVSGVWSTGRGRRIWTLGTRFWRPLLYQLSYTPISILLCADGQRNIARPFWWAFGDSNPGPSGYEPGALTNWAKGPCLSFVRALGNKTVVLPSVTLRHPCGLPL